MYRKTVTGSVGVALLEYRGQTFAYTLTLVDVATGSAT
jgi:hypothetical protein